MGVERAVTRWYVQRQRLLDEVAELQGKLVSLDMPQTHHEAEDSSDAGTRQRQEGPDVEGLKQALIGAQERLRSLGPCPKPMMG